MVVIAAHSSSQFVPGSVIGLGFLWLTSATLTGCNFSHFPPALHWGWRGRGFESRRSDQFFQENNEVGRYGVKAALLAIDFGPKFGAKFIPILLH